MPPRGARVNGSRSTRERGRPARMHSRSVPLSFPAMAHPATLPAGTAWARPNQTLTPPGSAWARLRPRKPAHSPLRSKSNGSRPTRERGRPARMHCRNVPLRFPTMALPVVPSSHDVSAAFARIFTGQPASPSRRCSTSPREAARTANRSGVRRSAAPPVRR